MKRSGFTPNQQHQAFTSLQAFPYNQPDRSSKSKHNYHGHGSNSNYNYNYNPQSNKNNFRKKGNNNFGNQHRISVERPKEKQTATTAFSIGIGQAQISSSLSTPSLNQPEIKIEKRKSPKLELRSSGNQNLIFSSTKIESDALTSYSNEIVTRLSMISDNEDAIDQQSLNTYYDDSNQKEKLNNENDNQISELFVKVPIKEIYTPEEILSLKPSSPTLKKIQSSGFITFLRFFSENSQEYDGDYRYGRKSNSYKKNRNYNWKNNRSSKKMILREHSENRFVGLNMVSRAGLSNEFSEEIKRSQAQLILNKLSKINITRSLNEINSLKIPLDVIIDLLLNAATSDSDFPERNPQIGNMLDFTFRFCSVNNEFKSKLISKSLSKSEEINNKTDPLSQIGSLQSTITWLAALFAGFTLSDIQFVNFANQVIEKQPIERSLEIIRTGLYVAGKSLDERNKDLGQPLFEFLQNNKSKHGYTNFLISELFFLRNSGWNINAIENLQSNGNRKKAIHIIKRSNSQSLIQGKQESGSSLLMASSSSASNMSQLTISDSNKNYYNDSYLPQTVDEIELLFLSNKASINTNLNMLTNDKSILTFTQNHTIETAIHTCFFLFKKHIQNANDFAFFTEKLILAYQINNNSSNEQSNDDSEFNTCVNCNDNNDYDVFTNTEKNTHNEINNNEINESTENNNIIIQNEFSNKVFSLLLNEQSTFESIVLEEESKQLWFPVFMLNAYLYSDNIIQFDNIIQSYAKIPEDCFKPSKILFINKVAEITGAPVQEIEKLYSIFHTKNLTSNEEKKENDKIERREQSRNLSDSIKDKCLSKIKSEETNIDEEEKLFEALVNFCDPLENQYDIRTEIAAGVFIRDIFDELFDNCEKYEVIDAEKIKKVFNPYKEIIDDIVKKFGMIIKNLILIDLKQCEIDEEQMKLAIKFFNIE